MWFVLSLLCLGAAFWFGTYWQANKNYQKSQDKIDEQAAQLNDKEQQLYQDRTKLKKEMREEQDKLQAERTKFGQKMREAQDKLQAERTKFGQKIREEQDKLQAERTKVIQQIQESRNQYQQEKQLADEQLRITQQAYEAVQRQINGYGDEYLIPTMQLIDEVAEEYSIHRAGEQLKQYRATMRQMIKTGTATDNEHIASKILLDFFNAEAEALISQVKHENYGKLKQKMADLYALTEYYAQQAHFAARIKKEYYQNRQQELKWASVVHTLRVEEREEQRALREQAREEERARKEYEKAMKDAAKEEAMLQAAMEKARTAMERASEAQKAQYEAQLTELNIKLKEAEERNQRALSMAQQTRAGHVYLISNIGSFGNEIMKIGMTRRLEPLDRVRELGDASVPFLFDVHAMIYSEDAPALEKRLHREFNHVRVNKVNYRKEFFRVTPFELKLKLQEWGIPVKFTMAAEAEEYRETQRIEAMEKGEQDKFLDHLLSHEFDENDE